MRKVLIGSGRVIAALLIAYAFIVVLMTASAQQRVMTSLADDAGSADYSSALVRLKETENARADLARALSTQKGLLDKESRLSAAYAKAKEDTDSAWLRFQPLARRASGEPNCGVSPATSNMETWTAILQCAADGSLSPRLTGQIEDARRAPNNFEASYAEAKDLDRQLTATTADLTRTATAIEGTRAEVEQATQLQEAFGELTVLRRSWLLGGGFLSAFPPALMQIILSFVAGTFGALLITLVLVVYPTNEFRFTEGKGREEERVFLGGLISLCVYIVLSGGTTILGSGQPFDGGTANVMTFTAVGVLAGMFSDRVAGWLSDKASVFFKNNNGASGGAGA